MAIYKLSDEERYTLQEAHRRDDAEWDRRMDSGWFGTSRLSREFQTEAEAMLKRKGYAVPDPFHPQMWVINTTGEFPSWVLTTAPGEEP